MSVMSDKWIMQQCLVPDLASGELVPLPEDQTMIHPFVFKQVAYTESHNFIEGRDEPIVVREKLISFGLSSFGYDARIGRDFKIFSSATGVASVVDPKSPPEAYLTDFSGDSVVIPPNSFVLGHTVEYFRIPRDVLVICLGKSTYARCGLIVNVTPLEPEWEGQVTIEISNTTQLPARVYANEGIAQFLFLKGDQAPFTSYGDRAGKYMNQRGIVTAKI